MGDLGEPVCKVYVAFALDYQTRGVQCKAFVQTLISFLPYAYRKHKTLLLRDRGVRKIYSFFRWY